jgi:hypothetical protein
MLEGFLNYLPCSIVKDEAGVILANSFDQGIMFLHAKENLICMSRYKAIKI